MLMPLSNCLCNASCHKVNLVDHLRLHPDGLGLNNHMKLPYGHLGKCDLLLSCSKMYKVGVSSKHLVIEMSGFNSTYTTSEFIERVPNMPAYDTLYRATAGTS